MDSRAPNARRFPQTGRTSGLSWSTELSSTSIRDGDGSFIVTAPLNSAFSSQTQLDISITSAFISLEEKSEDSLVNIFVRGACDRICPSLEANPLAIAHKSYNHAYVYKPRWQLFKTYTGCNLREIKISFVDSSERHVEKIDRAFITFRVRNSLNEMAEEHHLNLKGTLTQGSQAHHSECIFELPQHIKLKPYGTWQACLTSISYPNPNLWRKEESLIFITMNGHEHERERFPVAKSSNPDMMARKLQSVVRRITGLNSSQLRIFIHNNRLRMVSAKTLRIAFSQKLGYQLGHTVFGPDYANSTIFLESQYPVTLESPINFSRRKCDVMVVKTPLVTPTPINSSYDNIFKIIPVADKKHEHITYQSTTREYFDIQNINIPSIKLTLETENGRSIQNDRVSTIYACISLKHISNE